MAAGKKSSAWKREGHSGADPVFPGSFGGWFKFRKPPSGYGTTPQQHKIGGAGRQTGTACKGKTAGAFKECRHSVMMKIFGLPA